MNHGGVGVLEDNSILLPPDLIRPLSIGQGTQVSVLYYPRPPEEEDKAYKNGPPVHDFVITPIPDRMWCAVGRLTIHLCHSPGTLKRIVSLIQDHHVSIVNAECTRSAHRYATWNLVVCFEKCLRQADGPGRFDKSSSLYQATSERLKELASDIKKSDPDREALFVDPQDQYLANPIHLDYMQEIHYFDHVLRKRQKIGKSDPQYKGRLLFDWTGECFTMHCHRGRLVADNGGLHGLLGRIRYEKGLKHSISPGCLFAEMNFENMLIRAAVIEYEHIHRYQWVTIPYTRSEPPATTRGLLNDILQILPDYVQLWRVDNHTRQNTHKYESGDVNLLAEDTRKYVGSKGVSIKEAVRSLSRREFSTFVDQPLGDSEGPSADQAKDKRAVIAIEDVRVKGVDAESIKRRIMAERFEAGRTIYDVFLSHASDDQVLAETVAEKLKDAGLIPFLASREMKSGDQFSPKIREALRSSAEICLLFTPSSKESVWVQTEWGAAWALKKRIVALLLRTTHSDLPDRVQASHVRDFHELDAYVDEVRDRYLRIPGQDEEDEDSDV